MGRGELRDILMELRQVVTEFAMNSMHTGRVCDDFGASGVMIEQFGGRLSHRY